MGLQDDVIKAGGVGGQVKRISRHSNVMKLKKCPWVIDTCEI